MPHCSKSMTCNSFEQGMTNDGRFTISVNTWAVLQIVLSKTNRLDDTKYNIQCRPCFVGTRGLGQALNSFSFA